MIKINKEKKNNDKKIPLLVLSIHCMNGTYYNDQEARPSHMYKEQPKDAAPSTQAFIEKAQKLTLQEEEVGFTDLEQRLLDHTTPEEEKAKITNEQLTQFAIKLWQQKSGHEIFERPEYKTASQNGFIRGVIQTYRWYYPEPKETQSLDNPCQ